MTTAIQSVIKNISQVTCKVSKKISIHITLMIMTSERKNYASMAYSNAIAYEKVYIKSKNVEEYLNYSALFLLEQIKARATPEKKAFLIIDFTFLSKFFAKFIPDVTYDYDGVTKRVSKGFSAGFVFWSDGTILIPFDFSLWLRKKDIGQLYKKKTELARDRTYAKP